MRVNLVSPSLPCLYCAGVIDTGSILAESVDPADRNAREEKGYVAGIDDDAPSVVSLTTMAASMAVFLFKDAIFSMSKPGACMVMADMSTLTAQALSPRARRGCVCSMRMGRGACMPMSAPREAGR